jgi:hypothetical protein
LKSVNMEKNTHAMILAKECVAGLQEKISAQENQIRTMGARISKLIVDLEDKTAKVERLSEGIEGEVERMVRPMRDKISEFMVLVMKEKAARAQERRELADLWPTNCMMPTVLMRHRSLSEEERQRRIDRTKKIEANKALALEIQANVLESKLWEVQYDDYGRPFFKHLKTSQTLWERPAIMDYKPPPGRDEFGNYVPSDDMNGVTWNLETNARGEVYYKRSDNGEISYDMPESYLRITPSKEPEMIVGEAALLVLGFIKEKVRQHQKRLEDEKNYEIAVALARKNRVPEPPPYYPPEDKFTVFKDLSVFVYDIETVEMLANVYTEAKVKGKKKKSDEETTEPRPNTVREKKTLQLGGSIPKGRTLLDVDVVQATEAEIRSYIQQHADIEEQLDKLLQETRGHLKVLYHSQSLYY